MIPGKKALGGRDRTSCLLSIFLVLFIMVIQPVEAQTLLADYGNTMTWSNITAGLTSPLIFMIRMACSWAT